MNREIVRSSFADIVTLVCVLALGVAFSLLPWLTTSGGTPGIKLLINGASAPNGVFPLVLIPVVAIACIFATLWGVLGTSVRRWVALVIFAAGLIGLIYYGISLAHYNQNEVDVSKLAGAGFWLALFACFGLVFQVFIPRPEFLISLRTREAIIAFLFLSPFLIFFSIFVVRAVISAFQMSFYEWAILKPNHPYIGLANYNELFSDYVWWDALKNTVAFALMTVTGTTVVALLAAVAVMQPIVGAGFFRVLLYLPTLLSVGVVGLTWVWLLNTQFGILNYGLSFLGIRPINWLGDAGLVIPALSLTSIWWGFGFPMLIFVAGLQGIPEHLYEAARIDGANGRQIFFYITIPLLRPTILFVTVTGFIAHFQVFGQPFIMTNGGPGRASYTVIFYLYQMAWVAFRMGYGAAVAITLAAIIAFFTALQFFFVGRRVEY